MTTGDELAAIYKGIVQWGIPVALLTMLHYLNEITKQLSKISESLAVVLVKMEHHENLLTNHDSRISLLEQRRNSSRS